jgi:hypothetical protein
MCQVGPCAETGIICLFEEEFTSEQIKAVVTELGVPENFAGRKDFTVTTPFARVLEIVEAHGGAVIPSRLDKTPYRQLAIEYLIEEHGIHAFDLVHPENTEFFRERWPDGEFTFFTFSNANALAQVGGRSSLVKLERPGFEGIKLLTQRREIEN